MVAIQGHIPMKNKVNGEGRTQSLETNKRRLTKETYLDRKNKTELRVLAGEL